MDLLVLDLGYLLSTSVLILICFFHYPIMISSQFKTYNHHSHVHMSSAATLLHHHTTTSLKASNSPSPSRCTIVRIEQRIEQRIAAQSTQPALRVVTCKVSPARLSLAYTLNFSWDARRRIHDRGAGYQP
jgi:hypothetical protein